MRILAGLALTLTLALPAAAQPTGPSAQAKEQARHLLDIGDAKFADKDYVHALEAYAAADKIMGVPTTGLAVAKASIELGKLVEAHDVLLRVARFNPQGAPDAFVTAQKEAAALAEAVDPRIPSLTIKLKDATLAGLVVKVNGAPIELAGLGFPFPVNPGEHQVVASATGYLDAKGSAKLGEKETKTVELELKRDPNYKPEVPPPEPKAPPPGKPDKPPATPVDDSLHVPVWAWIGFGVGGAALIAGGVTGGLALSKKSSLSSSCPANKSLGVNVCTAAQQSDIDSLKAMSNASTATFVIGGVGVAAGIAGVVVAVVQKPKAKDATALVPLVGPGFVGVGGAF